MADYSEPHRTAGTNTVLRWTLAPFGAVAALGLGFLVTLLVFTLIYGAEMKIKGGAPFVVMQTVAIISALIAWTWAGASIAPPHHRRVALGLFSAPVVLITVILAAAVRIKDEVDAGAMSFAVGSLLACAGILLFAFHPRFAIATVPATTPVLPTGRPAATLREHSRSASAAPSVGTYEPGASRASRPADRDGLSSGPPHARYTIVILRWVLAPFGAAAASVCALTILHQLSVYLFGREDIGRGGGAEVIVLPVVMCVGVAWAWAGASIAPRRHRRWALIFFAVPPGLFSCFALLPIASQWLPPGRIMIGVGSLLASAVVFAMASHPRYAAPLAARFEKYVPSEESNPAGESELSQDVAPSATTETQRSQQVASTTSFGARNRSMSQASKARSA